MITTATKRPVTLDNGTVEEVELKRLSPRQLYQFFEVLNSKTPADAIAMATGKSIEWVDTLSDEGFADLEKCVYDANFRRAMAMAEKSISMAIVLAPFVSKTLAAAGMVGREKSPSSSLPESAEVTPNVSSTSPATGSSS